MPFRRELSLPVNYKGLELDCGYRVDMLVADTVVVEIGLLVNFNVPALRAACTARAWARWEALQLYNTVVLFLGRGNRVAQVHRASAFAHVVAVPAWNFDGYVSGDYRLTAKPRVQCHAGRLIHTVHLVVAWPAQVGVALFDDDVAGCAGAAPAAGMLEVQAVVEANVEQRSLESVLGIGHDGGVVVDGHA